jgi:hypothetical protein
MYIPDIDSCCRVDDQECMQCSRSQLSCSRSQAGRDSRFRMPGHIAIKLAHQIDTDISQSSQDCNVNTDQSACMSKYCKRRDTRSGTKVTAIKADDNIEALLPRIAASSDRRRCQANQDIAERSIHPT